MTFIVQYLREMTAVKGNDAHFFFLPPLILIWGCVMLLRECESSLYHHVPHFSFTWSFRCEGVRSWGPSVTVGKRSSGCSLSHIKVSPLLLLLYSAEIQRGSMQRALCTVCATLSEQHTESFTHQGAITDGEIRAINEVKRLFFHFG